MKLSNTYLQTTIDLTRKITGNFFLLGRRLLKIREEKLWSGAYDTYEDFLEEANLRPEFASKLVTVVQLYKVVPAQLLQSAGVEKLYASRKLLENSTPEEVAEKAATLTRKDILALANGSDDCSHDWGENYTLHSCVKCRTTERVRYIHNINTFSYFFF